MSRYQLKDNLDVRTKNINLTLDVAQPYSVAFPIASVRLLGHFVQLYLMSIL